MNVLNLPKDIIELHKIFKENDFQLFVVGGAVRDFFLGKTPKDFDLVTDASPFDIHKMFDGKFNVLNIGEAFGIVSIVINGVPYEIAQMREEIGFSDSRHPDKVLPTTDLRKDCERRDFTINAMYFDIGTNQFIDFFDGQKSINKKIIEFVGNSIDRINEDKLRILRAFRLQSELGFDIELESFDAIEKTVNPLKGLSQERITAEFTRIVSGKNAFETIVDMAKTGILFEIIPELADTCIDHNSVYHSESFPGFGNSIFAHILHVIYYACEETEELIVRLAAVFHDIGKPICRELKADGTHRYKGHDLAGANLTKEILIRMKFPTAIVESVTKLVASHMMLHDLPKMKDVAKIRRLIGRGDFDALLSLGIADTLGTALKNKVPNTEEAEKLILCAEGHIKEFGKKLPERIVNGNDLISEGFGPTVLFKKALEVAFDQQLRGVSDKKKLINAASSYIKTMEAK